MQPQSSTVSSSWCGNLHHAQEFAAQVVRWLFGCLPCVKGHHQVHPTSFNTPGGLYIVIDKKKRLRVLHIVPDLNSSTPPVKTNLTDQVDAGDRCSLNSAGEDYWFMRWNRPIRINFQRNSCSCSFRKSQIKSTADTKDSKAAEPKRVASVVEEKTSLAQDEIKSSQDCLQNLAEKMSQDIVLEAVLKSLEIETSFTQNSFDPLKTSEDVGDNSSKCCDNVSVEDVKFSMKSSDVKLGGYDNPVFVASNDALDLIPNNEPHNLCNENECGRNNVTSVSKEHQDYNANEDIDVRNRNFKEDNIDKKRHRKSCLAGSKAYLKKPVLLFIHGAGSSSEVWQNLISHLVREGYECVAPDLLGHGLSSAPDAAKSYTFHSYLQDVLCIFDRFVTEGRSSVILGHGYGCSLAAAAARYRPEQVIQLVLISGGGPTPLAPRTPPSVSPCLRACLEPLLMCGFKRDVVYSVCGKQMVPITPETSAVPRHIVEHISQGHVWPEGDAAFHRRIVAPTLLVHGMRDQHITLVQQCEMERTIPRSFLEVIPEAGHWAMLETPNHLSHMILCFIDWWAPPNRTQ